MSDHKNELVKTTDIRELLLQLINTRKGTADELSISKLARKLGYSSSVVSQYLAEEGIKYEGDLVKLEKGVDDFIRNELRRKVSGVETMDSFQVQELRKALEYIRKTNDVGIVLAEAGVTKTRAVDHYVATNPLSILFRARQWAKDVPSVEAVVFEAVKGGWDGQSKRVKHAIKKLTGSDRLIIVDDAHKLNRPALQWFFDFHDETLCPIAFVGIYELEEKLEDDAQRFSRVGLRWEIKPENPRELINHLIRSLCHNITTPDQRTLFAYCEQVAEQHGHFRSVHKQLKVAAEIREGKPSITWEQAFKSAHQMLVRKYPLN
ncbi:MAG: AAA family ATPase [Verrucomicrobiota bacterium]